MSCENCHSCDCCAGCAGCKQNDALNPLEYALLDIFSVTPFLPVAINKQTGQTLLLDPELEPVAAGFALRMLQRRGYVQVSADRMLQRRGYVQVSADIPLQNASYHGYEDWKHGSAALTVRGQDAIDAMEYGG